MIDRIRFPPLNFPPVPAKVRRVGEREEIFDVFRKKFVTLSPEEWVRQHLAHFLTMHCEVPAGRVALETDVRYGSLRKRVDILVPDGVGGVWLLAECKAASVPVDDKVWQQCFTYASVLRPRFILVSNGINHVLCESKPGTGEVVLCKDFPRYI